MLGYSTIIQPFLHSHKRMAQLLASQIFKAGGREKGTGPVTFAPFTRKQNFPANFTQTSFTCTFLDRCIPCKEGWELQSVLLFVLCCVVLICLGGEVTQFMWFHFYIRITNENTFSYKTISHSTLYCIFIMCYLCVEVVKETQFFHHLNHCQN